MQEFLERSGGGLISIYIQTCFLQQNQEQLASNIIR